MRVLLAACGSALLAQQQNVIFSTGAGPGMAGAVGPNTFAFVSGRTGGWHSGKGAPYSGNAVTENTQTLADGNHIVNRTTAVVYRDGEGRERREQSLPEHRGVRSARRSINDGFHFRSGGGNELFLESG